MSTTNGGKPSPYKGALKMPDTSPKPPRFVSCERAPPPQPERRTWSELIEDVCYYVSSVCLGVFIIEIVIQIVLYGYLQTPGSRSCLTGQILTHYEVLDIDRGADQEAITTAWRGLSNEFHPDTVQGGNTQESRERYYWIQLAYVELSDPLSKCYHDQYFGYVPRKFGEEDACTKILMERDRDARRSTKISAGDLWDGVLRRVERLSGISFNWLKATKDKTVKWTTNKAEQWEERGTLWEQFVELVKRIVAWPFIAIGFLITITQIYIEYIAKRAVTYELRRRVVGFFS